MSRLFLLKLFLFIQKKMFGRKNYTEFIREINKFNFIRRLMIINWKRNPTNTNYCSLKLTIFE